MHTRRIVLLVACVVATTHALFPRYGSTSTATDTDPYGYFIGPSTYNATLYTRTRPIVGYAGPSYTTSDPFAASIRVSPTYLLDDPATNFTTTNTGYGATPTVMPSRVTLPWPYCLALPWQVVTSMTQLSMLSKTTPGIVYPADKWLSTPDVFFYFTTPGCEGGMLLYGDEAIPFGTRVATGDACSGTFGPRCNETDSVTSTSTCSKFVCSSSSTLDGDAYTNIFSLTETAQPVIGDIDPTDAALSGLFRGTITYMVPPTCQALADPNAGIFLYTLGSSRVDIPAPYLYTQQTTPTQERSMVLLAATPNCGTLTRTQTTDPPYDPAVRAFPVCRQVVAPIPSNLAAWNALNGFSTSFSSPLHTPPSNVPGHGTTVWLLVADNLPIPLRVRVTPTLLGDASANVSDVVLPDVFVGYNASAYVVVPGLDPSGTFPYGLRLEWFRASANRVRLEYLPGRNRTQLDACVCNDTVASVSGNVVCLASNYTMLSSEIARADLQPVYVVPYGTATYNFLTCSFVVNGGVLPVAGVPFWVAAIGSSTAAPGTLQYKWAISGLNPSSGGLVGADNTYNTTVRVQTVAPVTIVLTITDVYFQSRTCQQLLQPRPALPVINVAPKSAKIEVNTFLLLDGSASTTPAGDTLTFQWKIIWPDGTTTGSLNGATNLATVQFQSTATGFYTVQLVIKNTYGSSSANVNIEVVAVGSLAPGAAPSSSSNTIDTGCYNTLPPANFEFTPSQLGVLPPLAPTGSTTPPPASTTPVPSPAPVAFLALSPGLVTGTSVIAALVILVVAGSTLVMSCNRRIPRARKNV